MHYLKAWWSICENCNQVEIGISYTVHNRYGDCKICGEFFNLKKSSKVDRLNTDYDFMEQFQIQYGIAWGME